ncbi:MAG: isoprenyl transferase [Nitrospinota bacterium]
MNQSDSRHQSGGTPVSLEHIAIIMDGNGRWAKQRNYPRELGHRAGVQSVESAIEFSLEHSIPYLTLYAFSTENWERPQYEVSALMKLLEEFVKGKLPLMMKQSICLNVIGDLERLPRYISKLLQEAIAATKKNDRLILTLALSYGARKEILTAIKKVAQDIKDELILVDEIDEDYFKNKLAMKGIPDPDLLIRTGGELRLSNFLLWQLAYTELYFSDKLWPDFDKYDLAQAVATFKSRERRFGRFVSNNLISEGL